MDLMTKFNRGMILALVEKNVYKSVQMFREYSSYLNSAGETEELSVVREAFFKKIADFAQKPGDPIDLIPIYQELITAFPKDVILLLRASECFNGLEMFDVEFELLKTAQKIDPDNKEILQKGIDCAENLGKIELAREFAENLCKIENTVPNNFCVLSGVYCALYDTTGDCEFMEKAVQNAEIARNMDKHEKLFLKNLIILYTKSKSQKLDSAWEEYITGFQLNYEDKVNYGAYLMRKGSLNEGFKYYENRFFHEKKPTKYPEFNKPKYNFKDDISGKTLLIRHEQGFGDIFLFCRFLNFFKNKAKKVIFMVPKSVYSIMKRNFPEIEIVEDTVPLSEIDFDCHLPMMSMALAFNLDKNNLPGTSKYLVSDKNKTEFFREKYFKNDKFKIGISFSGNKIGLKTRNIPLEELFPLQDIEGTMLYAIQYGENDRLYEGTKITNLASEMADFDCTMSLIENLDLLISIDNSVMNLAGSIGKRTFCLFNYLPEYRWFDLAGEDVRWYKSVKPYQATGLNVWKPVILKAAKDIRNLLK